MFPWRTIGLLDEVTLGRIFSNIEVAINTNYELLYQLQTVMNSDSITNETCVGKAFIEIVSLK